MFVNIYKKEKLLFADGMVNITFEKYPMLCYLIFEKVFSSISFSKFVTCNIKFKYV